MKAGPKALVTDEPAFHDTVIMEHAGLWERGNSVRAEEPTVIFPGPLVQSLPPTEPTDASSEPEDDERGAPAASPTERPEPAR